VLLTRLFPVALVLLAATSAPAAEGVLPVRAGDRVEGEVRWCGDRHILAIELVKGERFRAKVRSSTAVFEDLTVRFYDPTGLASNARASVRVVDGTVLLGPFRVTDSGTHLLQITTFTRHEIPYEVETKIKGRRKRSLRVKARRARSVVAAAGSVLRMRGGSADAAIELIMPDGTRESLTPGSAELRALRSDGLTLPEGGTYRIGVSAGRAKLRIRAPRRADVRTRAFPELPDERDSVSAWYDDTGWIADPFASAPADHEPPTSLPLPGTPTGDPATGETLTEAPTAPWSPAARAEFELEAADGGHLAGIGMPIAPIPSVEEALLLGAVEAFADGPSYVYDVERDGLGVVQYRVSFMVGGRATLAPVTLNGHVAMRWHVEGGGTHHQEDWRLTFDASRGVEVLDGSATLIGSGFTTIHSAANGFALPVDGSAPYGSVSWSVESASAGSFVRSETHDGTGAVDVTIR